MIGVWTTACRQRVRVYDTDHAEDVNSGPFVQVSRLGNPLVNEVIIPMGKKDYWNTQQPADDKQFADLRRTPSWPGCCRSLYPGVFPHLAALTSGKARADLEAILLTGIPAGDRPRVPELHRRHQADMLRLNMAISRPPSPSILGLLGGDLAGFPNGRRVFDDVVTIELRAIAGATYPLVDKSYTPDAAANAVTDGPTPADLNVPYLRHFPTSASRTAASPRPRPEAGRPGARRRFPAPGARACPPETEAP